MEGGRSGFGGGLGRLLTTLVIILVVIACVTEAWSGPNVCTRRKCCYRRVRVCRYRWWWTCCAYKWITQGYSCTERYCCPGWKHNGNQRCNIPVCNPPCQNGGTCIAPGLCRCTVQYTGYRCASEQCSHTAVCFPGTCQPNAGCNCRSGFTTLNSNRQDYCLKIEEEFAEVQVYQMQVRMSYWSRANPGMEGHMIMADSTEAADDASTFWTNRRDFNRLETTCASQYFAPDLGGPPPYIRKNELGIVLGQIKVELGKIAHNTDSTYYSLNKTLNCDQSATDTNPVTELYNCSITDVNFDRFLEHGDSLKVTFKTRGGGYREVMNRDNRPPTLHKTQSFIGVDRSKSVEFKFDFFSPTHCALNNLGNSCDRKTILDVPDITKVNPLRISWNGWTDANSGMYRYAWEVFRMTKVQDNELEIKYNVALKPLINQEVLHANYAPPTYTLPGPGMYSVILQADDLANNTKFIRRLVLFDPDPEITTDPSHGFHFTTASEAADYTFQNDFYAGVVVSWYRYFRNGLHEDNALLGLVRPYPKELRDKLRDEDFVYRKDIVYNTTDDDWEGERTVGEIPNKRGITNFKLQYAEDTRGGQEQPQEPTDPSKWIDMDLSTTYYVSTTPEDEKTVTVWVKATDAMGTERVEKTRVTFDSTPPSTENITFRMNVPVEGIDFSSRFELEAEDYESGIAHINWTFTRTSSGEEIYNELVPGARVAMDCSQRTQFYCRNQLNSVAFKDCEPAEPCSCTSVGECFPQVQRFSVSNCHMVVEKENLTTEVINVTAKVTNMAGLVTTVYMLKDDLTKLNGTEAYYPPQNITVTSISEDSVSFRWTFPPTCFPRTAVWVVVNNVKTPVHVDNNEFALTGLNPGSAYTAYLVTQYESDVQSDPAIFNFTTEVRRYAVDDGLGAGAIIGIVIGLIIIILLVVVIVMFVLWRRGKIFQKEGTPMNKQMHRMSRAVNNVRKTVRRAGDAFSNNAYKQDEPDEIYLYGAMTFGTRQTWQLDESSLTLLDHLKDGRFATIYKAIWRHDGKEDNVAAKMLKSGFNEDDAMKMMAKINFFATKVDDHDNVIKFLGAVTDNQGWGPVMVMELCEEGQLDQWLAKNRGVMTDRVMEHLFQFSLGIARGMEHLAKNQIVHKRLAARNILLTFTLEPKVAGFGPQTKEGEENKATRIPAKWAAPEVLQDRPATDKCDVWAYGVVLWEIFSMGQVPYPNIHASEIGTRLKSGYRMEKPEFADDTYYDMMKECWQYKPNKRPTFGTLRARLSQQLAGNRQSGDFYYDTKDLHD